MSTFKDLENTVDKFLNLDIFKNHQQPKKELSDKEQEIINLKKLLKKRNQQIKTLKQEKQNE